MVGRKFITSEVLDVCMDHQPNVKVAPKAQPKSVISRP